MHRRFDSAGINNGKGIIKNKLHAFLFIFYCALIVACPFEATAAPAISVDNEVYDFGTILEGIVLTHEYVIENTGDSPLLIPRVRSTCVCAVADYTSEVLPGQKGSITVEFDSKGSGGSTVSYKIRVDTNDPVKGNFDLVIAGHVDPIAIIKPERAILTGTAGEDIKTELTITSDARKPFKILSAKPRIGEDISCSLKEIDSSEPVKYLLTIKNLRQEKGKYRDYVYLETDSDVSPGISIRVNGEIL